MDEAPDMNSAELEKELTYIANKFAWLLAKSDLDEDTQETLINALPYLELEQLLEIVSMMEAKYTLSQTTELDTELEAKLNLIANNFSDKQQARDEDLIQKLEALSDKLT